MMFRQSMLTLSLFAAFYANAESTDTVFQPASYTPSQMDFGGVGLIKMPTGENGTRRGIQFKRKHQP